MKQKGVPIKSVQLISEDELRPPIIITFVVQSSSTDDKMAPGDVIYINMIGRAVNLAQRNGLEIGGIGYSFINASGVTFCQGIEAIRNKERIPSQFDPPFILDYGTVSSLLQPHLSLGDMVLNKLDILQDEYGLRELLIELRAIDAKGAEKDLPNFFSTIRANISELNSNNNTQISSYKIKLSSTSGEKLLIYLNDLLLCRESFWQSDKLTNAWCPLPVQKSEDLK